MIKKSARRKVANKKKKKYKGNNVRGKNQVKKDKRKKKCFACIVAWFNSLRTVTRDRTAGSNISLDMKLGF